jgi:hypothetical protein
VEKIRGQNINLIFNQTRGTREFFLFKKNSRRYILIAICDVSAVQLVFLTIKKIASDNRRRHKNLSTYYRVLLSCACLGYYNIARSKIVVDFLSRISSSSPSSISSCCGSVEDDPTYLFHIIITSQDIILWTSRPNNNNRKLRTNHCIFRIFINDEIQ